MTRARKVKAALAWMPIFDGTEMGLTVAFNLSDNMHQFCCYDSRKAALKLSKRGGK